MRLLGMRHVEAAEHQRDCCSKGDSDRLRGSRCGMEGIGTAQLRIVDLFDLHAGKSVQVRLIVVYKEANVSSLIG